MKKIICIVFVLVVAGLIGCYFYVNSVDEQALIDEAKNRVLLEITTPDRIEFSGLQFLPNDYAADEKISGSVCGFIDAKMPDGTYAGKIKVAVRVKSNGENIMAGRALIALIGLPDSYRYEAKWQELCKGYEPE